MKKHSKKLNNSFSRIKSVSVLNKSTFAANFTGLNLSKVLPFHFQIYI